MASNSSAEIDVYISKYFSSGEEIHEVTLVNRQNRLNFIKFDTADLVKVFENPRSELVRVMNEKNLTTEEKQFDFFIHGTNVIY